MDIVKWQIANFTHKNLKRLLDEGIPHVIVGHAEVTNVDSVTDLETQIRVRTPAGSRYFMVKVSEMTG